MKMKGQPNQDSNPVPASQEANHATNWANEAGNSDGKRVPTPAGRVWVDWAKLLYTISGKMKNPVLFVKLNEFSLEAVKSEIKKVFLN